MDEKTYVILRIQFDFALEVWISIYLFQKDKCTNIKYVNTKYRIRTKY